MALRCAEALTIITQCRNEQLFIVCLLAIRHVQRHEDRCKVVRAHAIVQGCEERGGLASFEVNFMFEEAGVAKAALVKLRLCPKHALHLNYQKNQLALQVRGSELDGPGGAE